MQYTIQIFETGDGFAARTDPARQGAIWREMLMNHAENQWVIGTVAGALDARSAAMCARRRGLAPSPLWGEEPAPGLNGGWGEGPGALAATAGRDVRPAAHLLFLSRQEK